MNYRTFAIVAISVCMLAAPASARAYRDSWGKVDVSFSQYREDAAYCAVVGMVNSLQQAEVQPLEGASGGGATISAASSFPAPFYTSVSPGLLSVVAQNRMVEARQYWDHGQVAVDDCLTDRGYSRFRLDADQVEHLESLEAGSEERHQYLYSLATDPYTLEVQAHPISY